LYQKDGDTFNFNYPTTTWHYRIYIA